MKIFPYFNNSIGKSFNKKRKNYLKNIFINKISKQYKYGLSTIKNRKHKEHIKQFKKLCKNNKFVYKIDIEKYYLNIDHSVLKQILEEIYIKFIKNKISKGLLKFTNKELPKFLIQSLYNNKGLSIGSGLSSILADLYLFRLDYELEKKEIQYIRRVDDILIFYNTKQKEKLILNSILTPQLEKLKLSINPNKSYLTKTYNNEISYIGYTFKSGYLGIEKKKMEEFKQKITKLTDLRYKTKIGVLIKKTNKLIYGRGHYYKYSDTKQLYKKLDSYIRNKIRRKLTYTKSYSKNISNNLTFTNEYLYNELGLASLEKIKENMVKKTSKKSKKTSKKGFFINKNIKTSNNKKEEIYSNFLLYKEIKHLHKKIDELTKVINKIKKEK